MFSQALTLAGVATVFKLNSSQFLFFRERNCEDLNRDFVILWKIWQIFGVNTFQHLFCEHTSLKHWFYTALHPRERQGPWEAWQVDYVGPFKKERRKTVCASRGGNNSRWIIPSFWWHCYVPGSERTENLFSCISEELYTVLIRLLLLLLCSWGRTAAWTKVWSQNPFFSNGFKVK